MQPMRLYSYPQILTLVTNINERVIDSYQQVTNTFATLVKFSTGCYLTRCAYMSWLMQNTCESININRKK